MTTSLILDAISDNLVTVRSPGYKTNSIEAFLSDKKNSLTNSVNKDNKMASIANSSNNEDNADSSTPTILNSKRSTRNSKSTDKSANENVSSLRVNKNGVDSPGKLKECLKRVYLIFFYLFI